MKNHRTPRTLSDCSFDVGYPLVPEKRTTSLADALLAIVLGIIGAALLVHFLSR